MDPATRTWWRPPIALVVATAHRFYADQCLVRASALAYTALLSIVPLLAVMFAVLKGLGVQERLEGVLLSRLSLDQDTTDMIIGYIDNTNFGTLGAFGAAALVLTVISVLGTIESSFNLIWRVAHPRSLWRQVTDYVSVVMLTPFLLLAAVAITSAAQVQALVNWIDSGYLGGVGVQLLNFAPALINAAGIGVLYAIMPNRRPAPLPVLVGALFAGVAWHLVQVGYVMLQVGVARNNAIYGALAQLPVTLLWLYLSWTIVLAGAELAAVLEFGAERAADPHRLRRDAVALHLLVGAADAFTAGRPGVEPLVTARQLRVDPRDMTAVVECLRRFEWVEMLDGYPHRLVLLREPSRIELSGIMELIDPAPVPYGCDERVAAFLTNADGLARGTWASWTLADVLGERAKPAARAVG